MEQKESKITMPLVISVLSLLGGVVSYFFMKDTIPIHWDVNWQVDGSAPKEAVFIISALPLILYLTLGTRKNAFTTAKGNRISVIACIYLLVVVQWISIIASIKPDINIELIVPCIVGAFVMVLGNFMPVLARNRYIGFRTPWSVKSNLSWRKSNRIMGYFLELIGILLIISGIMQRTTLYVITVISLIVTIVIGVIFSYHYWKIDPEKIEKN